MQTLKLAILAEILQVHKTLFMPTERTISDSEC